MATERLSAVERAEIMQSAAKPPSATSGATERFPEEPTGGQLGYDANCGGEHLLDSIFAVVTHALRATRCSIMLLDENDHLIVHKSYGLRAEVVAETKLAIGERIAGKVAATREPLLIGGQADSEPTGSYSTSSFISVPIVSGHRLFGVLNTADKADGGPFDYFDLTTLTLLARHVAVCIENADLHRQVARLANTDDLTGLYNHRYFQNRLEEEVERARRFGRQVALLMTDLDSFKEFNDTYGHPAGDLALRWIANVLQDTVRQSDIVCRYGGDEFAIIAPETDVEEALALAGRLDQAIAGHAFQSQALPAPLHLGLSIGVSSYPRVAASKTKLVEQADRAMYTAKQKRAAG